MSQVPSFNDLFQGVDVYHEEEQYTERKISITDLLNVSVIVLGFKSNVRTANGCRHLVRVKMQEDVRVFFTSSKSIISVLEHERVRFPFAATIKSYMIGDKRGYKFT
jgi:hypothetical protein